MALHCAKWLLALTALALSADGTNAPAKQVQSQPHEAAESATSAPDLTEVEAASEEFLALTDNAPLAAEEMPAYWRLMRWSRDASFETLARQARTDVLYTQLRQRPEKYRGQVMQLNLRLRRSLRHDAPANKAGVKFVYEAWGCTSESHPYPYLIVFSEPPPKFPLGATIEADVQVAGYFLKSMAYEANGKKQAAPLLIGQVRWPPQVAPAIAATTDSTWLRNAVLFAVACALFVFIAERWRKKRPPSHRFVESRWTTSQDAPTVFVASG